MEANRRTARQGKAMRTRGTIEVIIDLKQMGDDTRFRFRTATLVGPWRRTQEMARRDAIKAGQIYRSGKGEFSWRVEGEIETKEVEPEGERQDRA